MKAAFFPFTQIHDPEMGALLSCFEKIVVYPASGRRIPESMREAARLGKIDARLPPGEDDTRLDRAMREGLSLMEGQSAHSLSRIRARQENPGAPFVQKESARQIRGHVLAAARNPETGKPDEKNARGDKQTLFNARLFLCLAQAFDTDEAESRRKMASFKQKETRFLSSHGKGRPAAGIGPGGAPLPEDPPGFPMIPQRLLAWARLARLDENPPGIFVTAGQEILAHVMERVPGFEPAFDWPVPSSSADSGQNIRRLERAFAGLSSGKAPASVKEPFKISFYTQGGISRRDFLSRLAGHPPGGRGKKTRDPNRRVIIGAIPNPAITG
ncbi:hypothetical protein EPICR_10394 [Candidatus Desulfarcum epimagneticum]|uniref:Uncharacterized protein n=1 Tax=uncultured Desulfobacteraceae bacterium TaxID=218296 RepID=A0A484HC88_9BACT|nr:hypothetical protein EPICR_10394 [uncultured Desulfobacteraceae bacterium]